MVLRCYGPSGFD
jgi:hypothetical protein